MSWNNLGCKSPLMNNSPWRRSPHIFPVDPRRFRWCYIHAIRNVIGADRVCKCRSSIEVAPWLRRRCGSRRMVNCTPRIRDRSTWSYAIDLWRLRDRQSRSSRSWVRFNAILCLMTITINGFITTNVPIIEFFDNDLILFYGKNI